MKNKLGINIQKRGREKEERVLRRPWSSFNMLRVEDNFISQPDN